MGFLQSVISEARSSVSELTAPRQLASATDFSTASLRPSLEGAGEGLGPARQESFLPNKKVGSEADLAPRQPQPSLSRPQVNEEGQLSSHKSRVSEEPESRKASAKSTEKTYPFDELNLGADNSITHHLEPTPRVTAIEVPDQEFTLEQQHSDFDIPSASLPPEKNDSQVVSEKHVGEPVERVSPEPKSLDLEVADLAPEISTNTTAMEVKETAVPVEEVAQAPLGDDQSHQPAMMEFFSEAAIEKETEPALDEAKSEELKVIADHPVITSKPTHEQSVPSPPEEVHVRKVLKEVIEEPLDTPLATDTAEKVASSIEHLEQQSQPTVKHDEGIQPTPKVVEKTIHREVERSVRETVREDKAARDPSVSKVQKVVKKIPDTGGPPTITQPVKKVVQQQVLDSVREINNVTRRPEVVARQHIDQGERRPYSPTLIQPQPAIRQSEVKIGQVDVFIEGPQRSNGPAASSPRPTLGLASRHYLRRI